LTSARGWYQGRVAIVTGASKGIGRAIAERLAREGASLVLTAIEDDLLLEVEGACRGLGASVTTLAGDLADEKLPERLASIAQDKFGGLDVVVNNAFWEEPGAVGEVSLAGWDRTLRITLTAAMLMTRAAIPPMLARKGGSIVNISSMRAVAAGHGMAAYEAAKAGLLALTRSVAIDYGPRGIRCNCVCPGLILSERIRGWYEGSEGGRLAFETVIPLGRAGLPEEIASVVAFVGGPEASYMNGAIIAVDGGSVAGLPENAALSLAERFLKDQK
jgi:meso-butanediol dehydrogenase/(S,S)-butanediol dehydrogenase/diacetyl reductase